MVVEVSTKILVIGGIGYVGKFIVEASVKAGHPTFALVRESTLSNPLKSSIVQNFNTLGVNVILVCYVNQSSSSINYCLKYNFDFIKTLFRD